MNRRVTGAVLLAALVALSGCSSAFSGSSDSGGEEALQSSSESIESFSCLTSVEQPDWISQAS